MVDVIIIGGGAAGLSAGVVLARCRRTVTLIDAGRPRNVRAQHLHNYLTRDGIKPAALLAHGRRELQACGGTFLNATVTRADRRRDGTFTVKLESGRLLRSRKLLLATGVSDCLPDIPGFARFYGRTIHHCPYCDAFPYSDKPIVAYGSGRAAVGLARLLRCWSRNVTACTDGHRLSAQTAADASRLGVAVRTEPIQGLEGRGSRLQRIRFKSGPALECAALFFNTGQYQRSVLSRQLGCEFKPDGGVRTNSRQCTGIRGLYVAGDADKEVQFVIVAAAQGATAATAINRELMDDLDP